MRIIEQNELNVILKNHEKWKNGSGGTRADLKGADLRGADLEGANLRWANLRRANLRGANLRRANLRGADLRWADLRGADLEGANLRWADLRGADLEGANLRWADLRGANLDFCHIPLSCKGLKWKVDRRLMAQFAYHFCSHNCEDDEVKNIQNTLMDFANEFHRVNECGKLEKKEFKGEDKEKPAAKQTD